MSTWAIRQVFATREERQAMRRETVGDRDTQGGFALILAILALLLLTFLGLTLATTTSTELQIANNYRWSQQARYNAEAGLQAAKALLRGMDWSQILPPERIETISWDGLTPPGGAGGGVVPILSRNDAWGNPSRNFENWQCDERGNGIGYGVVLDDGGADGPVQYRSNIFGQDLNGAFTLWVRRPTHRRSDGFLGDVPCCPPHYDPLVDNDTLILVSEGVAPFTGGASGTAFVQSNQSVQVVEAVLSRVVATGNAPCGTRGGQAGGAPSGAGFGGCDPITGEGLEPVVGEANTGTTGGLGDTGAQ
jgi:hypothetical protein